MPTLNTNDLLNAEYESCLGPNFINLKFKKFVI